MSFAILDLFKQYEMRMNCFVISDYINDSTKPLLTNDGNERIPWKPNVGEIRETERKETKYGG